MKVKESVITKFKHQISCTAILSTSFLNLILKAFSPKNVVDNSQIIKKALEGKHNILASLKSLP